MYLVKIFCLHFLISLTYNGYFSYKFVVSKQPNPVSLGIGVLIYTLIHLIVALIIVGYLQDKEKRKGVVKQNWMVHASAIIFWFLIYLIISKPLSNWLWSMR